MSQSIPTTSSKPARNLVLCLDGTSNRFGAKNTNVIKLFALLQADKNQLIYYDSGIGSSTSVIEGRRGGLGQTVEQVVDMALAIDFPLHVTAAYQWLSDYYDEGDQVYLFGFSRGAYTARVLAGMVESVGLLPKGNHSQVPLAWQMFRETQDGQQPPSLAAAYKKTFSRSADVEIKFIGVWDTVASLGGLSAERLPFASKAGSVEIFRQALALDERRVKFQPEFYEFGKGEDRTVRPGPIGMDDKFAEVWFAGCHSDVGGGETLDEDPALSDVPLRWMIREAYLHGLRLTRLDEKALRDHPVYGSFVDAWDKQKKPNQALTIESVAEYAASLDDRITDKLNADLKLNPNESLTLVWKLAEVLPAGGEWLPHLGRGRTIENWQKVHGSVYSKILASGGKYQPAAEFRSGEQSWTERAKKVSN